MAWAICLILAVAIVLAASPVQTHILRAKQQTLSVMKTIPAQLAGSMETLKGLQRDQEQLNQLRSALAAMRSKSPPASPILFKLSEIMNDETWVVHVSMETDEGQDKPQDKAQDKVTNLRLMGFSTSNEHLGDFLSRLSAERLFKAVVLKFASESEKEEQSQKGGVSRGRIRFEIACQIQRG